MNEANIETMDDDSMAEAGGADERTLVGGEEHMATTRLPPLPRPPGRSSPSSHPPAVAPKPFAMPPTPRSSPSVAAPHHVSTAALSSGTSTQPFLRPLAEVRPPPHPEARTSWWRALLTSSPPSGQDPVAAAIDARGTQRVVAAACAAVALVLVFIAVGIGLRGEPPPLFVPPIVAAATILARALVALGVLAFGLTLLRTAERLFMRSG